MTTTVKHKGKEREWSGPIENWEAHSDVIKHWCDGGEVEALCANGFSLISCYQPFSYANEYRIKAREPKAGEVWEFSDGAYIITQSCHGISAVRLDGNQFKSGDYNFECGLRGTCVAPSLESYYAQKFIDECQTMDSGWPYDDCMKLLRNLKEKAGC